MPSNAYLFYVTHDKEYREHVLTQWGQGKMVAISQMTLSNPFSWMKMVEYRLSQFEFTDGFQMIHKAWHSIEEVSYWFSRSSVKFQGHTGQQNHQFWPKLSISGL